MNYLQFKHFSKISKIVHGIFTRKGGTSLPPFDSLNLGLNVGDDPAAVEDNKQRIIHVMGLSECKSVVQTHSRAVHVVDSQWDETLTGDALMTCHADILLLIKTADCQPVLLLDPENFIVSAIHSGWRGSVQNIIGATVEKMSELGSNPEKILAGIGPSLGPCCAEFINFQQELPEYMWSFSSKPNYFDFWAISSKQLRDAGIQPHHIEIMTICTRCRPDLFFSYRNNKLSGRFASVIGLRP
ncbi:MAG: peptidoglycan editing factor PgeF [Candidatus Magnetomorum sp.]|nr:peptidoglycan editing factor PgeF [Candidatus Magnetomorum sp.]